MKSTLSYNEACKTGDINKIIPAYGTMVDEAKSIKGEYDAFREKIAPGIESLVRATGCNVNDLIRAIEPVAMPPKLQEKLGRTSVTNSQHMTKKDKGLMTKWEKKYPEWTWKNRSRISFGSDELGLYIGFEITPGQILKLDRQDLTKGMDWETAQEVAKEQGKRLPTGDGDSSNKEDNEWLAMIRVMPGLNREEQTQNLRKLANLQADTYWSSTTYAPNMAIARVVNFSGGDATRNSGKTNSYSVRLVH